jgi:hypothetical protein
MLVQSPEEILHVRLTLVARKNVHRFFNITLALCPVSVCFTTVCEVPLNNFALDV